MEKNLAGLIGTETQDTAQEEHAPHVPVHYHDDLVFIADPGTIKTWLIMTGEETGLLGQVCKYPNEQIINDWTSGMTAIQKGFMQPEKLALWTKEREEAGRVLDFARELLHSLYELKGYTEAQRDRYCELLERHPLLPFASRNAADEHGFVPAGRMHTMGKGGLYSTLSAGIMNGLRPIVMSDWGLLLKCPVCGTIFARDKDKPKQIYDCRACQNLIAVRRHREKTPRKKTVGHVDTRLQDQVS